MRRETSEHTDSFKGPTQCDGRPGVTGEGLSGDRVLLLFPGPGPLPLLMIAMSRPI